MSVPVVILAFDRPAETRRVLDAVRSYRPAKLLVVTDGPHPGREDDAVNCAAVRAIFDRDIDWPCEVARDDSPKNLGCARRIASGLDWAFKREAALIVLEDDCVPAPSFFPYCEELLARYADTPEVGQICGCTRYHSTVDRPESYLFSRYGPVWGWAALRRAWQQYDLRLSCWPAVRESGRLRQVCRNEAEHAKRPRSLRFAPCPRARHMGLPVGLREDGQRAAQRHPDPQPHRQHRLQRERHPLCLRQLRPRRPRFGFPPSPPSGRRDR